MKNQLFEVQNQHNQTIRWIQTLPNQKFNKNLICLHWFERCATTEKKFKALADSLVENMTITLRLDFTGCGLSDGDFRFTTIDKQAEDFLVAIKKLKNQTGHEKINIIAHSLGACILAKKIDEIKQDIEKIILIAPALNQKELMRYRFISWQLKKSNPEIEITRQNYKQYLDEKDFQKDCERTDKMIKANYIEPEYFLDTKDFDFSNQFDDINDKILHIHGSKDISVPIQSINTTFANQIIIENGDHDLEKPIFLEQWKTKVIEFLLKK